jgi:hypothetical protein
MPALKLSEKELAAATQCGIYAFPFKKVFIVLRIADALQDEAERAFYSEGSELYKAYERGRVDYDMHIDSLLFKSATSTDKEARALDRSAYIELQARRDANLEEYEAQKRDYEARKSDKN